jgi:proliferating cell nuclear antigen PCNA
MKLILSDNIKKDLFIALFQVLRNCSENICIHFYDNYIYIQGMDKSHICLFDIKIFSTWFDSYEKEFNDVESICFNSIIFHTIINSKQDNHKLIIHFSHLDCDNINIDILANDNSKGEISKFFKIPLVDFESEMLNIPEANYDAEFTICSKKICEIASQMLIFGNDINIRCDEDKIDLITNGITGEMKVNICIDDLSEYSICEGEIIDLKYSLNYISKMCLTNRLSANIEFSISSEKPMRIKYNLGDDGSIVLFYIAPKVED